MKISIWSSITRLNCDYGAKVSVERCELTSGLQMGDKYQTLSADPNEPVSIQGLKHFTMVEFRLSLSDLLSSFDALILTPSLAGRPPTLVLLLFRSH